MSRRARMPLILKGLLIVAVVYGLVVLLAWRFQERIAFPGPSHRVPSPARFGIPDGEVVTVRAADGVALRGWYLPPSPAPDPRHPAPGLIWFYGNMETVGGLAPLLAELRPPGIGMLVLDYRGYGESGGTATEAGLYRDAEAAWAFLAARREIDLARIAVYGRSLGSAMALYLATERPVRAVVLESPFSSGRDMAREHYPLIPAALLRLRLDNLARAARLSAPLLVLHGTEDDIAPLWMGEAVARAGRAEAFVPINGAGHNDTYDVGGARYRDTLHAFLQRHLVSGEQ